MFAFVNFKLALCYIQLERNNDNEVISYVITFSTGIAFISIIMDRYRDGKECWHESSDSVLKPQHPENKGT